MTTQTSPALTRTVPVLDAVHMPADESRSPALTVYYAVKPLIPRRVQLAARRRHARLRSRSAFPRWPIEPFMVERLHAHLRSAIDAGDGDAVPLLNLWPGRRRFALVLTHDVEGPRGVANVMRMREVERRHGLVSAWNFVGEDYPVPDRLLDALRADGCEIGLHGVTHRGTLFRSRADFERQLPRIRRRMEDWGAVGFRSPATHRNSAWMPELGCLYDSSFPDTDPFEPQPGGCGSIYPFFLGDLVELPITLPQDHTLFDILGEQSTRIWREKASWIVRHHGLVCVVVHPDYALDPRRLALYEELLQFLTRQAGAWHALPRDVARWWRARAACETPDGPAGPEDRYLAARATVAYARKEGDEIVIDV
jgi:peptidoglycan/xylan/chitin deacetylase (PgdA/CDA1 family)